MFWERLRWREAEVKANDDLGKGWPSRGKRQKQMGKIKGRNTTKSGQECPHHTTREWGVRY